MRRQITRHYETTPDVSVFIEDLLSDRGITDVEAFVHPQHPTDISLKQLLSVNQPAGYDFEESWQKTLSMLKNAHDSNETIVVYTDYDADGVTGGAIMWEALHLMGFKVIPYIPARKEGYGFSLEGIDAVIHEHNPSMIISVDHGIVAHKMVSYMKQRGLGVIVTDHHHMQDGHPLADAVFHSTDVSGAGVAYFFTQELAKEMGHVQNHARITSLFSTDYVALAAIGVIADLIPLVGPARSLARAGLGALSRTTRVGLREIMRGAGVDPKSPVTAYHVGFMLAPRINAFGRLDHAMDALRLLCTTSLDRAVELAGRAEEINTRRQSIVQQAVTEALKQVVPEDKVIMVMSDQWEEGIIGLIASKLMQTYYRPVIVMALGETHAKASVRSIDGIHITNFLHDLKDYLVDMGGHAAAGGFTIHSEKIVSFVNALQTKAREEITDDMLVPVEKIDVAMPLSAATLELARALNELGPFGMYFHNPTLLSRGSVEDVKLLGKTASHVKLSLSNGSRALDMLVFQAKQDVKELQYGDEIEVLYTLDINVWNGRETVQGIAKSIHPAT